MLLQFRFLRTALLGTALAAGLASAAQAQPKPSAPPETKPYEMPGGDIFGFTNPTGKRAGSYWSPTLKTQFSFTQEENLSVALSPWVTAHRIHSVPTLEDRTATRFDGFSGEVS